MKCGKCGKRGAIELRYSGDFLCKNCFLNLFEKRVRKTIRVNKLLEHDDRIVVGLSGGKDSVVTLHILKKLSRKAPKSSLTAISIDEGIRGYSKECVKRSKEICKKLGVEHHVFSIEEEYGLKIADIAKKIGGDVPLCSYCGVFRRRLLNDKVRQLKATKIATGHNLDDEIQAMVMNIMRSDFRRIARMGATIGVVKDRRFVPRIKPLRDCLNDEILAYARFSNLKFYPEKCPNVRDAFRNTIRNAIDVIEERHPGSKFQLLKSTDELIWIMRKNYKTGESIGECKKCGEPTSGTICKVCEIVEHLA